MGNTQAQVATLILNASVEIAPIRDFPAEVRRSLGGVPSDFILSERSSRLRSQRIDAETAAFLRLFVRSTRIIDAVLQHAAAFGADPADVLEDAYPLIVSLRDTGILVEPLAPPPCAVAPDPIAGQFGEHIRVLRRVRVLADTEVYEAALADGTHVAVKYVKGTAPAFVRRALDHEYRVLRAAELLAPGGVPLIFAADLEREDPYLVLTWHDGRAIEVVAQDARLGLSDRRRIALNLLAAYVRLHDAGIIHGDVQPNNVLVDAAGGVALIDFGGASLLPAHPTPQRVGFLLNCEPELAAAYLEGSPSPIPSCAGEQYCVAVLVYQVLTGRSYLPLALETDLALRQIVHDEPLPVGDIARAWPSVERVLRRALAKDPRDRYPSLVAFERDLRDAIVDPGISPATGRAGKRPGAPRMVSARNRLFQGCAEDLIADYGLSSVLIGRGLRRGPTASIYYGAAGIAYALLRLGTLFEDAEIVSAADLWIEGALARRMDDAAFNGVEIGLLPNMTSPQSFLNGMPGLLVVQALVRHVAGDPAGCDAAVREFISAAGSPARDAAAARPARDAFRLDVAHGAAGILLGAALLYPACRTLSKSLRADLRACGMALRATVEDELAPPEGGEAPVPRGYLGFAHGRAGAIYALLRWSDAVGETPSPPVARHLASLSNQAIRDGRSCAWPIEPAVPGSPSWAGWCHGSAGHALLWLAAARIDNREDYRALAVAAGEHIWATRQGASASLCCGLAGEALVLFDLAHATGSEEWAARGQELAALAVGSPSRDHVSHSLFRGDVGVRLAAIEALDPAQSCWPLWQSFL